MAAGQLEKRMENATFSAFEAYLNRYCTTSAEHESAFDEYLASAPCPPAGYLHLDTAVERFIMRCFREHYPPSIILTGNAGDGKTYLSRRIISEFTGVPFEGWQDTIDHSIPRNGVTLHVVKDLSEVDEERGSAYLSRLAQAFHGQDQAHVFLIAANEGRLRQLLLDPKYKDLRTSVDHQLREGPNATDRLVVINLNQIATSLLLPQVLSWLTNVQNWPDLNANTIASNPIHFNIDRLRRPHVQERLQLLYRLLERLGHHITIRDMLIHLAFTVTAGKTSTELLALSEEERRAYAYYNNAVGATADPIFRERSTVLRLLAPLKLGHFSCYELDDFIINGHETAHAHYKGYQSLFERSIDLGINLFAQDKEVYLYGTSYSSEAHERFLSYLPAMRRKVFFEWDAAPHLTQQLIPFERFSDFENLLEDPMQLDNAKQLLILGLNRAFSGLYLEEDEHLLLTSQYTNRSAVTVPIVMTRLPATDLDLTVTLESTEVVNRHTKALQLVVYPPARLRREVDEIHWRIDLLTYEYLVRRALGGTPDVLAEECELEIRMFKDRLTQEIVNRLPITSKFSFIGPENHGYQIYDIHLQPDKRIVVRKA